MSWQLPTWIESLVLVGALSRLGAMQNPIIPIYRAREVGFAVKQTGAAMLVVPSQWGGFDYEAMAQRGGGRAPRCSSATSSCPRATRRRWRHYPDAGPDAVRWIFYTSGTTADPKGARHTDGTVAAAAVAMADRVELTRRGPSGHRLPVHPHRRDHLARAPSLQEGNANLVVEAFNPADHHPAHARPRR